MYLAVILDAKLTWKKQVDARVRKGRYMMWAYRRVCSRRWGLRPRVVLWLYAFVVRSSITYASLVWWPGCETTRAKQLLSLVQRLACLGFTGAMRTTPTNAMEALVGFPRWIWLCRGRLGPRRIAFGAWGVGHTVIPTVVTIPFWCGFTNRTLYLIWGQT
jgi:hypothetical protein